MFQGFISTDNSTTTPLTGGGIFTGASWEDVKDYGSVVVIVRTDQNAAAGGLVIQWSSNGSGIDAQETFDLFASDGRTIRLPIGGRYFRVKLTNGGAAQGFLRLQTLFTYSNNNDNRVHDGDHAPIGATTDAEATGNGSAIGILKRLRTLLGNVLNVRPDLRVSSSARRYMIQLDAAAATSGINIASIYNPAGEDPVRIYRLRVQCRSGTSALGSPLAVFRATGIANGTAVAQADIPKLDTSVGNAVSEIRTNAGSNITGTLGNLPLIVLGGRAVTVQDTAGPDSEWVAADYYDQIVLNAEEGLVFQTIGASNGDIHQIIIALEETS